MEAACRLWSPRRHLAFVTVPEPVDELLPGGGVDAPVVESVTAPPVVDEVRNGVELVSELVQRSLEFARIRAAASPAVHSVGASPGVCGRHAYEPGGMGNRAAHGDLA
jgi:hypothetical protein